MNRGQNARYLSPTPSIIRIQDLEQCTSSSIAFDATSSPKRPDFLERVQHLQHTDSLLPQQLKSNAEQVKTPEETRYDCGSISQNTSMHKNVKFVNPKVIDLH
jgi:hypothetical protein